jgi:hypothetical protein
MNIHVYTKENIEKSFILPSLLIGSVAILIFFAGCILTGSHADANSVSLTNTASSLTGMQESVLDLALKSATAIPIHPHIKDRSKAQESVVKACLALDQPQKALAATEQIDNWRRGLSYANLAYYWAQKNDMETVQRYKELALAKAHPEEEWQRDRIRVRIAQAYTLIGLHNEAGQLEQGVVNAEAGKVDLVKAMLCDEDSFDEQMKIFESHLATGDFDLLNHTLTAYTQMYNRFYADTKKRTQIENTIKSSWTRLPIFLRLELLEALAQFALGHSDVQKAKDITQEAQQLFDSYDWPLDYHIALAAKLVTLRHLTHDAARARKDADAVYALYKKDFEKIVNIWRAKALRPLAEAYQKIGVSDAAAEVYARAVEDGVVNPNSRPRAEDLTATCCSMLIAGFEPPATLMARMQEIFNGLGQPW